MKFLKYLVVILLILPITVEASTKAVVDITNMSITDLAEALDKGYLTSELLVTLYLERIEAYDSDFNTINQLNENAIAEAKALDAEREAGNVRSVLHGIPIVVKTNIDVEGLATTAGATALSDNYPLEDALVIQKLKEAGAIILASTNMSEFAFAAGNSNSSYGQVGNAFNPSYTPYGSSGGSAVAVALSFAAASLGTDTNSSVRVPAAAAGLVGLRPTLDLISTDGVIPYDTTRDTVGIITKTVTDNALILSVINDYGYTYETSLTSLEGIKIGVVNGYLTGTSSSARVNNKTDEDIASLATEKIALLEEAGAEIIYIDELVNSYYYSLAYANMSGDSFCDGFNAYLEGTTGSIRSFNSLVKATGKIYSLSGYVSGCNGSWLYDEATVASRKEIFENHILEVFTTNNLDLIVYPTTKNKIFTLGSSSTLNAPGSFLGSVIGYPSLTVPMGYIEGFPYGLEFFSLENEEELLYSVAAIFEELNDLSLTNSPLTPSLYEIPEYIEVLMTYYEEENTDFNEELRTYFLEYSSKTDTENEVQALDLIAKIEDSLVVEEKEDIKDTFWGLASILGVILILFIIILRIVYMKVHNLYRKLSKQDRQVKKNLLKYKRR